MKYNYLKFLYFLVGFRHCFKPFGLHFQKATVNTIHKKCFLKSLFQRHFIKSVTKYENEKYELIHVWYLLTFQFMFLLLLQRFVGLQVHVLKPHCVINTEHNPPSIMQVNCCALNLVRKIIPAIIAYHNCSWKICVRWQWWLLQGVIWRRSLCWLSISLILEHSIVGWKWKKETLMLDTPSLLAIQKEQTQRSMKICVAI